MKTHKIEKKIKVTPELLESWANETEELARTWATTSASPDAIESNLSEMYSSDAEDARLVAELLREGSLAAAVQKVYMLDTSPRENYNWYYSLSETSHRLLHSRIDIPKIQEIYIMTEGPSYEDLVEALNDSMSHGIDYQLPKTIAVWEMVK